MSSNTPPKPLAVTVRTACQLTGLGRTNIYELIKSGRLATTTVGRRRLIRFASIEELVAA